MTTFFSWLDSFRTPRPVDLASVQSVNLTKLRTHFGTLKARIDYHTLNRDAAHAASRPTDYLLHESLREALETELTTLTSFLSIK